eukprot:7494086-Pyramimonas_sp.AAC.1
MAKAKPMISRYQAVIAQNFSVMSSAENDDDWKFARVSDKAQLKPLLTAMAKLNDEVTRHPILTKVMSHALPELRKEDGDQ